MILRYKYVNDTVINCNFALKALSLTTTLHYSHMFEYIESKSILSRLSGTDSFFGISYNMNLYRGCQHGCIYCDTRSDCYQVGNIAEIRVKKNAIDLLRKELSAKRIKGTIGTGSMNDPYMPIENKLGITRQALEVIAMHHFPVHIITKGNLVTRDANILQQINKTYAAVSFTITTANDDLARKIEPVAPTSSKRFEALETLAKQGIYTGVTFMPLLPGINDNVENVKAIVEKAKNAGASYVMPMFGVTLRKGSRDYLFKAFDEKFPGMKEQYQQQFGEQYECNSPHSKQLYETFYELIYKYGMTPKMKFYEPEPDNQLTLF